MIMARLEYNGYRLLPSCAADGGYLVQDTTTNDLVATVVFHPDAPRASRWWMRPYYSAPDASWGKYPLLREAAQAGYDERSV
jgi:hypothetical protein